MRFKKIFLGMLIVLINYSAFADLLAGYLSGIPTVGQGAIGEYGVGGGNAWLARPFSTGAESFYLDSISFGNYISHHSGSGALNVVLFSDNAGKPGGPVGGVFNLFSAATNLINGMLYPSYNPVLAANSTYWFVAWADQSQGDTRYWWDVTTSTAFDSDVSGTDMPLTYANNASGAGWVAYPGASLPMSVYGSVVPEPGTVALTGLGMGTLWLARRRRLKRVSAAQLPSVNRSKCDTSFIDEERGASLRLS